MRIAHTLRLELWWKGLSFNKRKQELITLGGNYDRLSAAAAKVSKELVDVKEYSKKQTMMLMNAQPLIEELDADIVKKRNRILTLTDTRNTYKSQMEFVAGLYVQSSLNISIGTPVTHITAGVPLVPRRFKVLDGEIVAELEYLYADQAKIEARTIIFPVNELDRID